MLLVFGTLSMSSNDVTEDFKSSKPDVIIVDNDKSVLSNNLVKYFNDNANVERTMHFSKSIHFIAK